MEPFPSTDTSMLSSLPNILHSHKEPMEEDEEEEEEDVRTYTMGPVLRVGGGGTQHGSHSEDTALIGTHLQVPTPLKPVQNTL